MLKRIYRETKGRRPEIWLSVLLALLHALAAAAIPFLAGLAIDQIAGAQNVNFGRIGFYMVWLGLLITLGAAFSWFSDIVISRVYYATVRKMRGKMFEHVNNLPLSYLDKKPHGDLTLAIVHDVDVMNFGAFLGFHTVISGVFAIAITVVMMFLINPVMAAVVVALTPVSVLVSLYITKKSQAGFRAQAEHKGRIAAVAEEFIAGSKVVKLYGLEEDALRKFNGINAELRKSGTKAQFYGSLPNPATRFASALIYAALVLAGALIIIGGEASALTVGMLSAFLLYANQYSRPFANITGVLSDIQTSFASGGRVFAVLDEPAEKDAPANGSVESAPRSITDTTNTDTTNITTGATTSNITNSNVAKTAPRTYGVSFKDITFSYGENPVIKHFSLEVPAGSRVAIVGETGSGKTTLINLLMRFYRPQQGKILLDGADIATIPKRELRKHFGMVLQDTWLKSGCIAENIAYAKQNASRDSIVAAAKAAHAHDFICRLPQGYGTILTDEGMSLSDGQRQLLSIARLMLIDPPILILDEATASIDFRTESAIQEAFQRVSQGKTCFIVAHRLATVRNADIVVDFSAPQ